MAKSNNIRKRALEHAKKQRWDKALEEFERLVEFEQNNPNVYNEIGDLYLKLGQKREAFRSYHSAVDAYSRISLQNNAVAVCKKILRLNPSDQMVCGKLATLRHKQGFHKDAVAYALNFLEKAMDGGDAPRDQLKDLVVNISRATGDSVEVLERAAEYLIKCEIHDEAGTVLEKLEQIYANEGLTHQCELARKRMDSIGYVSSNIPGGDLEPEKLETVELHRSQYAADRAGDDEEASADDYGMVELGEGPAQSSQSVGIGTLAPSQPVGDLVTEPTPLGVDVQPSAEGDGVTECAPEPEQGTTTELEPIEPPEKEWVIPDTETKPPSLGVESTDELPSGGADDSGGFMRQLSSEVTADIDEEDYRSHYDLGMAYLEMNLLAESIREFQYATNSSMYQIRSIEMIGRCFLQQNKPELAVKQLTRGLSLVGDEYKDSLGIRYCLGAAYEMIGDIDKAKSFFEDVYVVDVTFRDVADKMEKYAS